MSALLHRVGEALYGHRWQSDLARDLDVSGRTMRRWAAGHDALPRGVADDLRMLCIERAARLAVIAAELAEPKPARD